MDELFAYGFIILVIACFIVLLFFVPSEKKKDEKKLEKFDGVMPTDFLVFNYFPTTPIRMISAYGETIIDKIEPLKAKGLLKKQVDKYIRPGMSFSFYALDASDHIVAKISDYVVNGNFEGKIKNLHVGMITTRYIANTTDNLHMTTTHANAGQGSAWLIIHNLTDIPLSFNNGGVTVAPKSTTRYLGYLNQGVTLGTYFKEDNGIFPDYQYLQPYNNLYYGLVSNIQQPLSGCLQVEFNDQCEYGQTLWPFQEGIY